MEDLIYTPTAPMTARALLDSGAYLIVDDMTDENSYFTYKSGDKAPVYCNCRTALGDPGAFKNIELAFTSSILSNFPDVDLVVGVEASGIPWSSRVAGALGKPQAFVRKAAKGYGADQGLFVGKPGFFKGVNVVLVDDLVNSGGSIENSVLELRSLGFNVLGVHSIVNWNSPKMRETFKKLNLTPKALVSYPQILDEAMRRELIDGPVRQELELFYRNLGSHKFNFQAIAKMKKA